MFILNCRAAVASLALRPWRAQRVVQAPAPTKSAVHSCVFDSKRVGNALDRWALRASVFVLFVWRGPAAVGRLVVSIWVDTVDRMRVARALAHVVQEARKRLRPLLAHANSCAAVSAPTGLFWIRASRFHRAPYPMRARVAFPVRGVSCLCDVGLQATTTARASIAQVVSRCDVVAAALTQAQPRPLARYTNEPPNDRQASEALLGQIKESRHVSV